MRLQETVNTISLCIILDCLLSQKSHLLFLHLCTAFFVLNKAPPGRIRFNLNERIVAVHRHFVQTLYVVRVQLGIVLEIRGVHPHLESHFERKI